jgi:hypothetical protein
MVAHDQRQKKGILAMLLAVWLFIPWLLSAIALFLSIWIILPAPNFFLLPLGVGAPEISPWLIGGNAIAQVCHSLCHTCIAKIFLDGA